MKSAGFTTRAIHEPVLKKDIMHALRFPVHAGVAYDFDSAESMADAFSGRKAAHAYSRISNPTVEVFERRMTALEDGLAAVAVSSGMASISTALLNILEEGDNIVSSSSLFGGTYSLFQNVLRPIGVKTRFVAPDDPEAVESAIDGHTRAIYLETISNPCMVVPDFGAISTIARKHHVMLIADSTVTTPYLFHAARFGVNIVIHSTTKYISGGATSMGGVIVDLGNFDWSSVPALKGYHRLKEWAFIARLRREVYRELGSCLSPHNAYLQSLGLETLALRMDKACRNAQSIAEYLATQSAVRSISYPGLLTSPFHELAKKQFSGMSGGILSFNLPDKASCFGFLNRLSLIRRASNLGDNKTLALHPASTIFAGFSGEEMKALGVDDTLIRISAGIEDIGDIIEDVRQALEGI
jgi:O-acetylhomoserine (thiol)-lyase